LTNLQNGQYLVYDNSTLKWINNNPISVSIGDWIFTGPAAGITGDTDLLTLATNQVIVAGNLDVTSGIDVTGAALTTAVGITNTAGEVLVSGGNLQLNDSVVLSLGTDDDLTVAHDGTNSTITSNTGNLLIDNTVVDGATIFQLGSDANDTAFQVKNNTGGILLEVAGDGNVTGVSVDKLDDVELTTLLNGQYLVYDSTTSKWINNNPTGGSTGDWVFTGPDAYLNGQTLHHIELKQKDGTVSRNSISFNADDMIWYNTGLNPAVSW
jgi:hypothetical protein